MKVFQLLSLFTFFSYQYAASYIDYESAVTEQNRNIKVIKPLNIRTVANEFIKVMSGA